MGYLPEAVCNYLLRLGWSHGNAEIIARQQAIEWFGLDAVGKSAARFDMAKLDYLNGIYLRNYENRKILDMLIPKLPNPLDAVSKKRLERGMTA